MAENSNHNSETTGRIRRKLTSEIEEIEGTLRPISDTVIHFISLTNNEKGVKFRYVMSKFCKRVTLYLSLAAIAIFLYLFFSSSGSYLSAWFVSITIAIAGMFIISMPRYIKVTQDNIEIHCLLELTNIPLRDVRRIHIMNNYRTKRMIPLVGSYGFGGYYGYYFDLIHLRIVRMFATKLIKMVVIQDIYNERYIVNCEKPTLFINTVRRQISKIRDEEIVLDKPSGDNDDNDEDE